MKSVKSIFFAVIILCCGSTVAQIDRNKVLFGVEYTFQDFEMVHEPGRNTLSTPHKENKVIEVVGYLRTILGLPEGAVETKTSWKPGLYLHVPRDGAWVINSEPVTIEINTPPRYIDQLLPTAKTIFEATQRAQLQPYMQVAAERSGMGHIHIGAASMGENPFYRNPLLLRNLMVYLHKSPSLLHGFAEAFDIGMNSNIETYHSIERQQAFSRAVEDFDRWFRLAGAEERAQNGLNMFLRKLYLNDSPAVDFFHHYRFLNLEHLRRGVATPFQPTDLGKITVELRNFRPPKDPATTVAFAEYILRLLSYQAREGHVEPFEWISHERYLRFNSAAIIAADWEKQKRLLNLDIPELEQQIREYIQAVERFSFSLPEYRYARIFLAHSRKDEKGLFYEIRIPELMGRGRPELWIGPQIIEMESVVIQGRRFWTGVLDIRELNINPGQLLRGARALRIQWVPFYCRQVFAI